MQLIPVFVGSIPIGDTSATGQTLFALYSGKLADDAVSVTKSAGRGVLPVELRFDARTFALESAARNAVLALRKSPTGSPKISSALAHPSILQPTATLATRTELQFRALLDVAPVLVGPEVIASLRQSGVSVVHSLLGNVQTMRLALDISRKLDVPIVPHFMDDWPSSLYANGELMGRARGIARRALSAVLERSPIIGTIGTHMAAEYTSRYNRETFVAANGYFPHEIGRNSKAGASTDGPRVLAYSGGLHLGRLEALLSVASWLRQNRPSWTLLVSTASDDVSGLRASYPFPNLRFVNPVEATEVSSFISRADALLYVESSRREVTAYTRLSVSTKVPQYLASRQPILVVGPPDQASIDVLTSFDDRVAYCGDPESSDLSRAFSRLEQMVSTAAAPGPPPEFSVEIMRSNLEEALMRASLAGLSRQGLSR